MRFLFCSLANHGMLYPAIGLALELRARGHEVAFATDPSMSGMLANVGLERLPRGDRDGESFRVELSGHPLEHTRQVKHVEHALARFPANVLVGQQLTLGPLIAGERQGLPVAVLGLGAYLWPTCQTLESERFRDFVLGRYEGFYKPYLLTRYMFGLPELPERGYEDTPLMGDMFLLRSVPELEGPAQYLPPRVHMVGDCLWDEPVKDEALTGWLEQARAAGEVVVYAQPGRVFKVPGFWQKLAAALSDLPVRVVASVGRMDSPVGEVPERFLVRRHVPQALVLPYASAVICSSTTTAVLGALREGVPLLLVPGGGGGEQEDLTDRCLRAGVAVQVPPSKVSPEALREALARVVESQELRHKVGQMREALARAGGLAKAADLLERLASQRGPVLREEGHEAQVARF